MPSWGRFFAAGLHRTRDPESLLCEPVFADPLLFPLQRRREASEMLMTADAVKPVVCCELGSDKGGSVLAWCQLPSVRHVIACEVRGTPYAEAFEKAFPHIDFLWLPQSSYAPETLAKAKEWLRLLGGIDVLFIDSDKTAFLQDFDAWLPLMAPGGIVFMHDVQDRLPRESFEAVKARGYRTRTILDTSESGEAVARERAGIPCETAYEGWLRTWRGDSCSVGVIYLEGKKA